MNATKQIQREVYWALAITCFYILGWVLFAYFSPTGRGWLGLPIWFELACLYLPLMTILLIALVVKWQFKSIDLETPE